MHPLRELDEDGHLARLHFHEGQMRAWRSDRRFVFLLGGTQVGKTSFGPHWLHREIQRKGPGDYIVATATYPLLSLKALPEFRYVFEVLHKMGTYRESEKVFQLRDGGRVIFASATNAESIESATAKAAWLDEVGQKQFRREAWEAILRRLSLAQGRILGTTTLYNWGWLKAELYDRWQAGDESIDVIQVDSLANPAFPREEYERARVSLPDWKFQLFYRGRYAKPAGLIYDAFDSRACVIPRFPIPQNWLVHVGHDFGGANMAAMFYAQDPATGLVYAFHEYHQGNRSTHEHVKEFERITKGLTVVKRIGGSHQEVGWRGDFTSHGWPIQEPTVNEVEVGIERVYGMHRLNKVMVFSDLHEYLDEKGTYSRVLDDRNEPTEKIEEKERYHLMDAERYVLGDFRPDTAKSGKPHVWVY